MRFYKPHPTNLHTFLDKLERPQHFICEKTKNLLDMDHILKLTEKQLSWWHRTKLKGIKKKQMRVLPLFFILKLGWGFTKELLMALVLFMDSNIILKGAYGLEKDKEILWHNFFLLTKVVMQESL